MNTILDNATLPDVDVETLYVLDTTARPPLPERTHEILLDPDSGVVRRYTFTHNEYLPMPVDDAMKLVPNEAFIVKKHADGARIRPIPRRISDNVRLQDDQCVAHYDELTQACLLIRAKTNLGSEDFTKSTKKGVLIDFLIKLRSKSRSAEEAAIGEDNIDGAADDDASLLEEAEGELDEQLLGDFMPKPRIPGREAEQA